MKKLSILILILCFGLNAYTQSLNITGSTATITGSVAGCLSGTSVLSNAQKSSITGLIVSGAIDATDFLSIQKEMQALTLIDLSHTTIASCTGNGPNGYGTYAANTVPASALRDLYTPPLTIKLPTSATAIEAEAFYKSAGIVSLTLPTNLLTIGDYAFLHCTSLTTIKLPASLKAINNHIFEGCSALQSIQSYSSTPSNILLGADVFYGAPTSTCILQVPPGSLAAYTGLSQWKNFTNISATLASTTTLSINGTDATINNATPGCLFGKGLMSTLQKESITSLTISGDIDASDFCVIRDEMKVLETIDLKNTTILSYTGTAGTGGTANITYPSGTIPQHAFQGRIEFKEIFLPETATSIDVNAFSACEALASIYIPNSVTSIGGGTFAKCLTLASLELPTSLTSISSELFRQCIALTSITIPTSVSTIGAKAFSESGITSIAIPVNVNTIEEAAFNSCNQLTTLTFTDPINSKLERIMGGAFAECSKLESIVLPKHLTDLDDMVFANCIRLKTIYSYPKGSILNQTVSAFENVLMSSCIVRVPEGGLLNYTGASVWATFPNIVEGLTPPTITLQAAEVIGLDQAIFPGDLVSLGDISSVEYGITWGTKSQPMVNSDPTYTNGKTSNKGPFSFKINPLKEGITYYARPYTISNGTNSYASITYGNEISFTTPTLVEDGKTATITGMTAGGLEKQYILIDDLKNKIQYLNITGTIDIRDFKAMSDGMPSLRYIDLSGATVLERDGEPANRMPSVFIDHTQLLSIKLPQVTTIGIAAFNNCSSLQFIDIPSTVSSIESYALGGCTSLEVIAVHTGIPFDLSNGLSITDGIPFGTCKLRVPRNGLVTYQEAEIWKNFTNIVEGFVSPTVLSESIGSITKSTATANVNITSFGDLKPIQYGVIWNTSPTLTVDLTTKTTQGVPSATGTYSSNLTGLTAGTTYYVRPYVTNNASNIEAGTTYGDIATFTTTSSQLTISVAPTIVLKKVYDGTNTATLTNYGTLSGISAGDIGKVTISATATYADASLGTDKTITVKYSLSGTAAGNYVAPSDYIVKTGEIDKELKLYILLQGLWNGSNMNQCMKEVGKPMYSGDVVEHLTVELHKDGSYKTVMYTFPDLELHKDGTVASAGLSSIALTPSITGSYYITVKSRNHLETASSKVVDFKNNSTSYDFTGSASNAYASSSYYAPVKTTNGKCMMYAGDPLLDSEYPEINLGDLYYVFNNRSAKTGTYGYLANDLNGTAEVDDADLYLLFANRDVVLYIP